MMASLCAAANQRQQHNRVHRREDERLAGVATEAACEHHDAVANHGHRNHFEEPQANDRPQLVVRRDAINRAIEEQKERSVWRGRITPEWINGAPVNGLLPLTHGERTIEIGTEVNEPSSHPARRN